MKKLIKKENAIEKAKAKEQTVAADSAMNTTVPKWQPTGAVTTGGFSYPTYTTTGYVAPTVTTAATTATTYTLPYTFNINSGTFGYSSPYIFTLTNRKGETVFSVDNDGKIIWQSTIESDVKEAAENFSSYIGLEVEKKAGIYDTTKRKIRDSIFNDLIKIAVEKGSLNADDLTYLLEASKMLEKLKGDQ
jgi:hypothetical protein